MPYIPALRCAAIGYASVNLPHALLLSSASAAVCTRAAVCRRSYGGAPRIAAHPSTLQRPLSALAGSLSAHTVTDRHYPPAHAALMSPTAKLTMRATPLRAQQAPGGMFAASTQQQQGGAAWQLPAAFSPLHALSFEQVSCTDLAILLQPMLQHASQSRCCPPAITVGTLVPSCNVLISNLRAHLGFMAELLNRTLCAQDTPAAKASPGQQYTPPAPDGTHRDDSHVQVLADNQVDQSCATHQQPATPVSARQGDEHSAGADMHSAESVASARQQLIES